MFVLLTISIVQGKKWCVQVKLGKNDKTLVPISVNMSFNILIFIFLSFVFHLFQFNLFIYCYYSKKEKRERKNYIFRCNVDCYLTFLFQEMSLQIIHFFELLCTKFLPYLFVSCINNLYSSQTYEVPIIFFPYYKFLQYSLLFI